MRGFSFKNEAQRMIRRRCSVNYTSGDCVQARSFLQCVPTAAPCRRIDVPYFGNVLQRTPWTVFGRVLNNSRNKHKNNGNSDDSLFGDIEVQLEQDGQSGANTKESAAMRALRAAEAIEALRLRMHAADASTGSTFPPRKDLRTNPPPVSPEPEVDGSAHSFVAQLDRERSKELEQEDPENVRAMKARAAALKYRKQASEKERGAPAKPDWVVLSQDIEDGWTRAVNALTSALTPDACDTTVASAVERFQKAVGVHNQHVKELNLKVPLPRFQKSTVTTAFVDTLVEKLLHAAGKSTKDT
eukprot:m.218243 g.218243  ORF g.218243 m.218243 type:complete len:300 (-) comp19146_c0_seq1:601-1500(-)